MSKTLEEKAHDYCLNDIPMRTDYNEAFNSFIAGFQDCAKEKDAEIGALSERIKKLEFMIENGLGWEDMKNE